MEPTDADETQSASSANQNAERSGDVDELRSSARQTQSGDADDGSDAAGDGRDETAAALGYYEAIDEDDYDRLRTLLAPEFVHDRPDRTFEGREAFVAFMREDRPQTDTTHEVVDAYRAIDRGGRAVRGRLVGADGGVRFEFVDVFSFEAGRISRIDTFTR